MTRLPGSLLMALAVLASVVQSSPVTINMPDSTVQEKEMIAAMAQMAESFFSQDNQIPDTKEPEADFEMRIRGFAGVIKSKTHEKKTSVVTNDHEKPITINTPNNEIPANPFDGLFSIAQRDAVHSSEAEVSPPAQSVYTKLGGGSSTYKLHTGGASWQDAKATCEREGAHLVVINSEEEAQLLADEFARHRISAPYDNQMWIGVSDIDEEGHFVTVQGQELSATGYTRWWDGQPDDWKVVDPNGEDCVTMMHDKVLNDVHCWAAIAFMCEAGDMLQEPTQTEAAVVEEADPTRPGYVKRNGGHSYKFHDVGVTWQDAKATCEREGAHLAVINSEEEAQLLADEFNAHPHPYGVTTENQMWVGANDIEEEGKFVTVLGGDLSDTGYSRWNENQPDDWKVKSEDGEDCVTMMRGDMFINDMHCTAILAFACEAEEPFETTTTPPLPTSYPFSYEDTDYGW